MSDKTEGKFTLPKECGYCNKEVDNKEIIILDDYKIYHPACFLRFKQKDLLGTMFYMQGEFQKSLKVNLNQQYLNTMILACIDELTEILRETPWKPWKKNQEFNKEKYKDEVVDLFHFFMNLCLYAGMGVDELYNRYYIKMEINKKRQVQKY